MQHSQKVEKSRDLANFSGTNQKMVDCDIANLDVNTRISKFPLKFMSGTKKAPAQIRFGMQIHFAGISPHIRGYLTLYQGKVLQ
jgi:hypothetical protein